MPACWDRSRTANSTNDDADVGHTANPVSGMGRTAAHLRSCRATVIITSHHITRYTSINSDPCRTSVPERCIDLVHPDRRVVPCQLTHSTILCCMTRRRLRLEGSSHFLSLFWYAWSSQRNIYHTHYSDTILTSLPLYAADVRSYPHCWWSRLQQSRFIIRARIAKHDALLLRPYSKLCSRNLDRLKVVL